MTDEEEDGIFNMEEGEESGKCNLTRRKRRLINTMKNLNTNIVDKARRTKTKIEKK